MQFLSVNNFRVCENIVFIRNAEQNYRDKYIESVMLEMTLEDINLYADAVDYAVVETHKQRMKEINQIVKKLWQETYCGKGLCLKFYISFISFFLNLLRLITKIKSSLYSLNTLSDVTSERCPSLRLCTRAYTSSYSGGESLATCRIFDRLGI